MQQNLTYHSFPDLQLEGLEKKKKKKKKKRDGGGGGGGGGRRENGGRDAHSLLSPFLLGFLPPRHSGRVQDVQAEVKL